MKLIRLPLVGISLIFTMASMSCLSRITDPTTGPKGVHKVKESRHSPCDNSNVSTQERVTKSQGTSRFGRTINWPQFRGPGGLGISNVQGFPTKWSAEKNIVWKSPLPGPGTSSPVTWNDHIYLTCHSGYGAGQTGEMKDLKRFVVCLDRKTGKHLWSTKVPTRLPEQPYTRRMHWHGYASNTPAVDGSAVYVFFGKSGVFALTHDGKRLWKSDVGSKHNGWGSGASLVLHKNLLIVNACVESESLIALDKKTGKEVWRVKGIKESWNTPILVDLPGGKKELAIAIAGKVLGIDPMNGKQLWTCNAINYYIAPSMVAHKGVVFCTGGRNYITISIKAGGRGDVSATHVLWKARKGSNVSSPVYHDGHLFFAHESRSIAYCLNARTGKLVYVKDLRPSNGNIYASPIVADGKIYYLARYGRMFVVAASPKFELLSHNDLAPDRFFNASPVVTGNRLLLRSDHHLYCIGPK